MTSSITEDPHFITAGGIKELLAEERSSFLSTCHREVGRVEITDLSNKSEVNPRYTPDITLITLSTPTTKCVVIKRSLHEA